MGSLACFIACTLTGYAFAGSGRSSQAVQALQALPPQQQLLLCALLSLRSQASSSSGTPSKANQANATPVKGTPAKPAGLPRTSSTLVCPHCHPGCCCRPSMLPLVLWSKAWATACPCRVQRCTPGLTGGCRCPGPRS